MTPAGDVRIVRLADLAADAQASARDAIDAIFWETVTVLPQGDAARAAFYDLWLGQYLRHEPQFVYLAADAEGSVGGYLVGATDNPARSPRFASLTYFTAFARQCERYPAHLHINLTADWRGRNIGGRLIADFATTVQAHGIAGLHVVTAATARNVAFYTREGFREVARTTTAAARDVVMLGLDLVALHRSPRA